LVAFAHQEFARRRYHDHRLVLRLKKARRGRIGHWLSIRGCSENAACGQCSERETHAVWMVSSGHRRKVLGPWTSVGSFWATRYR
jgi:hypothetical protein